MGVFTFLNCTNSTKSRNTLHIIKFYQQSDIYKKKSERKKNGIVSLVWRQIINYNKEVYFSLWGLF